MSCITASLLCSREPHALLHLTATWVACHVAPLPLISRSRTGTGADKVEVAVRRKGTAKQKTWHAVPLWVSNVTAPNRAPQNQTATVPITSCGCCEQGEMKLQVGISSNVLVPGDVVQFSGELDNQSTVTVRDVQFKLTTTASFSARGHSRSITSKHYGKAASAVAPQAQSLLYSTLEVPKPGQSVHVFMADCDTVTLKVASVLEVKANTDEFTRNPKVVHRVRQLLQPHRHCPLCLV